MFFFNALHAVQQYGDCQQGSQALRNKGSPSHTGYAPIKLGYKQKVQEDIQHRGEDQKVQRLFGLAQSVENRVANVVDKQKGQTPHVDPQIGCGIFENIFRGIQPGADLRCQQAADQHQHQTHSANGNDRSKDRSLYLTQFLAAEKLGNYNAAAHTQAASQAHKQLRNGVGHTNRCQRIHTGISTGNNTVGNVVTLLQHTAEDHGDGKAQQDLKGTTFRHVFHNSYTSFPADCAALISASNSSIMTAIAFSLLLTVILSAAAKHSSVALDTAYPMSAIFSIETSFS